MTKPQVEQPAPPVLVSVESGEELARELHEAAQEIGPHFGMRTLVTDFDLMPRPSRESLVAIAELALRRMAMRVEARRGGAQAAKPRSRA